MYECQTCGALAVGVNAARRHAKQGYKTQREAFYAGELHSLVLTTDAHKRGGVGTADAVTRYTEDGELA